MPVRPFAELLASARLIRVHPVLILSLGASLVLSTGSVCCLFGAFAAPWFACELFATQIGAATGRRAPRTQAWFAAGFMMFFVVLLVGSMGYFLSLGLGVDMPVMGGPPEGDENDLRTVLVFVAGGVLALLFILPLMYAPPILVGQGGSLVRAVLESARLVREDGLLAHFATSILSHLIQVLPFLLAAIGAAIWLEREMILIAILFATPLGFVSVPLGQGMWVTLWVKRKERVRDLPLQRDTVPRRALVLLIVAIVVSPGVAVGLIGAALTRSSVPREGLAPGGELVVELRPEDETLERPIRDTALVARVSADTVEIEAYDGGGAGALPLPDGSVEQVRVVRVRNAYAVEVRVGESRRVAWIDRAGVRLDDNVRSRLSQHVPPIGYAALLLLLVLTPVALLGILSRVADVMINDDPAQPQTPEVSRALRGAWITVGLLLPIAATAVVAAALSLT